MRTLMVAAALAMTFSVAAVNAQGRRVVLSEYQDSEGNHWLVGCVDTELAETLVANAGFQYGGGPVGILCIEGYWAVSKMLGN